MSKEFTRSKLYDLVWSEPLRNLAKTLGVSDVAIGKRCRAAGIPLPGVGYWAKKEAGKNIFQPPLPPRALGQSDWVFIGAEGHYSAGQADKDLLAADITPPPTFSESLDQVTARAKAIMGHVRAVKSLANPHPLVAHLLQEDEKRREKQKASQWPSLFDAPLFDTPFERRRLRILNSLSLALARCGGKPWRRGREAAELGVHISDQHINFVLGPIRPRPQHQYSSKPLPPDEPMKLEISWYEPPPEMTLKWHDEKGKPLEEQLDEIGVGFLVAAEWMYRLALQYSYQYRLERKRELEARIQREKEEAERKERERVEKIKAERLAGLVGEAATWRQAADIRAYVNAALARRRGTATGDAAEISFQTWVDWALAEADRIDPLAQKFSG